jgi:hypothetical protein
MPEQTFPNQLQETTLESEALKLSTDRIDDIYALAMVKETFGHHERFRSSNHDRRWLSHDRLYFGWVPAKNWEGSRTPRAAFGAYTTFDHVETALPFLDQALFGGPEWFQVEAEPGATREEAKAIGEHMLYATDMAGVRNEVTLAAKSMLLYGNGGVEVYWDAEKKTFAISAIDIRDFYIDPGTPTPNIDDARSVIRRKWMTVDELDQMRDNPGMRIPSKSTLMYMANHVTHATADSTKQSSEALRGIQYSPIDQTYLPLPADRKIEVLIYYSKSKIVWVLNRQVVAYNERNPYGFIPFCFVPCFIVPGRFYAQSFADRIEQAQLYIQGLMNARLDNLNLALIPPRIQKQGSNTLAGHTSYRPGAVFTVENQKDMEIPAVSNVTENVADEIGFFEMNAEKGTGINGVSQGTPRPGNANRTATGMQIQSQGPANRMHLLVRNIEEYLIIPMLKKAYRLIQYHTNPEDWITTLGEGQQALQIGARAFRAPIRFKITAASKMITRQQLAEVIPFIVQYGLAGPLVAQLQATGRTLDVNVLFEMIQDATGTARLYPFIRPMNEQEQAALQQPPPEVQAKMAASQQESQTRIQMGQMASQKDLQIASIQAEIEKMKMDNAAEREMIAHMFEQQKNNPQVEMAKAQMEIQVQKEKMNLEKQKMQQKMVMDAMGHKQKMAISAAEGQMKVRQSQQDSQAKQIQSMVDLSFNQRRQEQELQHSQASATQDMAIKDRQSKMSINNPKNRIRGKKE